MKFILKFYKRVEKKYKLHANNCQLTDIKIKNCPEINYFNVANNLLVDLDFLDKLNPKKLTILSIHSNDFSEQTLEPFSKFTNLQQLFLDNFNKFNFRKGIYNRFTGSLKPLQNLAKLEILSIGKTDIDSGLEYLPKSLRKIGFNSAIKADTGCSKLSQELKEVSEIEGVTEKLQQHEEDDPTWISDYYRIAPWRQALSLLGEEKLRKQNAQQWLDKNYPREIRKNIVFLFINDKNLKGYLDLKDFPNLEKVDCSDNKLTGLDLSNCSKLTHLYCDNNLFTDLNFLKILPHPEKLKELYLERNEKLSRRNLDFLVSFIELEELNIENCPFYGSLRKLKNLGKLQKIYISNTDIDGGLDDLPDNYWKIYCDSSSNRKSVKIVKQLSQYSEEKFDENNKNKRYYELKEWKENKQNNTIVSAIPLERLYVIRNNIQQFFKKWEIKNNYISDSNNWYNKLFFKEKASNLSELSKLKSPEELSRERKLKIHLPQFIGRSAAVVGVVLTFQDSQSVGWGITAIYPLAELLASSLEESLKNKGNKWKEFLTDADVFLDNYHELLGILASFEIDELGEGRVNKALKKLNEKIKEFLDIYDNGEIDINELITKRDILIKDLDKDKDSKVWGIINDIKELEKTVIEYRKSSYNWMSEKGRAKDFIQEYEFENQVGNFSSSSGTQLLVDQVNDKNGGDRQFSNLKHRRSINDLQVYELVDLQAREELQVHIEIPLKK